MKVVILAGGLGTRLSEETSIKPKPMVEIGGRPILWHIMKHYAQYGYKEFAVALGYRGDSIKSYFLDYSDINSDLTVDLKSGRVERRRSTSDDWVIHLVDTGQETLTGGRVRRLRELLGGEPFMLTYGDGVSNVDLRALAEFHRSHGKLATLTAVRPPARFGSLEISGNTVTRFLEKPLSGEAWVNGGYFVLDPKVLDYIDGDSTHLEREPLERLSAEGQLMVYRHGDFWQSMDTLRDVKHLNGLWDGGRAPWKIW